MINSCLFYALKQFENIIARDYNNKIGTRDDYNKLNDLLYIINDIDIFIEVYQYCNKKCSNESLTNYFGNIDNSDYTSIMKYLDEWSIALTTNRVL